MATLDICERGGRIVAVIRRFVEEIDSCGCGVGVRAVDEIEFIGIRKECAEVRFDISISILNMTCEGRINLVPVWDLNILALVPLPWRHRNLILGHFTTISLGIKSGLVEIQLNRKNGKSFRRQ